MPLKAEDQLYWVDKENQIIARHFCSEPDDVSALEMTARLVAATPYEAEIWQGQRFVARVKHDGKPGQQRTSLTD